MNTVTRKAVRREAVYPDTSLGPQLKNFSDTFSGFDLLRERFGKSGEKQT